MTTKDDTLCSRVASKSAWAASAMKTAMLDEAMPADFYDVKLEVTPKAPPVAMWGMAAVAYLPTVVLFLLLVVQGMRVTSEEISRRELVEQAFEEIKVTSKDISDSEWTCTMISKVTFS